MTSRVLGVAVRTLERGNPHIAADRTGVDHGVQDSWDNATTIRWVDNPCPQCGASAAHQRLTADRRRWVCGRCQTITAMADPPFDERAAPEGKTQGLLAIQTLKILAPVLFCIDDELLYLIIAPYFRAGWCARDVHRAMDYLPNGDTHGGHGPAWLMTESRDVKLYRLRRRLHTWRWSDGEVMEGGYTATRRAMALRQQELANAAAERTSKWFQQLEAARRADPAAATTAREVARNATSKALAHRRAADAREAEAREEQALRARSASQTRLAETG